MKVTLIQPPIEDFYSTPMRRQPLGLLYLAAIARQKGWDLALINGHSPKSKIMPLPPEMEYLQPYLQRKDFFPFKHYYHFGLSFEEIHRQIKDNPSDLFAVSSLFTPYYQEVDRILEFIRKEYPETPIVVGGGHATLYPEYYLSQKKSCNFVISGEGENGFHSLLHFLETREEQWLQEPSLLSQKNFGAKSSGLSPVHVLDQLPFPLRRLLKERDFRFFRKKGVSVLFSRGCPNQCTFCVTSQIFGHQYRNRTPENMLDEIKDCWEQFGTTVFNFEDDNFFRNPDISRALLEKIILWKEKTGITLDLTAMNGLSVERFEAQDLKLMRKAGFQEINLSLVTAHIQEQKNLSRPFLTHRFEQIASEALRQEFNVKAYFILGLPGQDRPSILQTLQFLKALQVKPIPSVYYQVIRCPEDQWKIQRSSAFANPGTLSREEQIILFRQSLLS